MTGIFQSKIPYDVAAKPRLPGIAPLDPAQWLLVDDAFAEQMAERARLLATRRDDVVAVTPGGRAAAAELLEFVLEWLRDHAPGYDVAVDAVRRPDGLLITLDRHDPMGTLGHLVQEDLCLMEKHADEHVLTAAVLCFPASWRLADKIGQPLTGIHVPVPDYDEALAKRVQRLFDGVQVGRPLWRFNALRYEDPALFQPATRQTPRVGEYAALPYLRSERQCVMRLPETRACVFSIHTFMRYVGQSGLCSG